ncbi:sigma-70 family RNA polymerase sigma factor [Alloalcanivorax mobilis]|uniref:sigma-70 family RNA polymerase sigma factor n=1 Tax=Alloalcanivorax mobilis TaxID=2019569 RepID=UPI000B5B2BCB|nr:sigma-70 family RNA polymerase sigma factor [Alloalcanivorax mobilis]ASK33725.1 RNA polymerase subunit sigma [Alcanivorax sp. N3-2A]|tara:strand:- start:3570 stop:4076 length:507 start_codon:yes stop_codon:yes gene_type:complete
MSKALQSEIGSLYHDHAGWLFGWLRGRLGGDTADAADLVQDTYVRLMVSGRYPGPGESRAFLTQIAKGLVIDMHRRRALESAYREVLAQQPEAQAPSSERQAITLETLARIDKALDALPARVRRAFLLSRFEGRTYPQIAASLGVSQSAVRKYMLRALQACLLTLNEA